MATSTPPLVPRVERPRLQELLQVAVRRRVCLVIGAAGWGKSTTVGSWTRQRTSAWLRHEAHGGDAGRFAASLLEALRPHAATAPPDLGSLGNGGQRELAEATCGWLRGSLRAELVLVIDDLHELTPGGGTARLVEDLCLHGPDSLRLLLLSRRECPFSLARLRGRGLVTEVHAAELAFDVAEIESLLGSTIGTDPPGLATRMWERTGGWPAAVCHAVDLLRTIGPNGRLGALDHLARPGERLHSYLLDEVLGDEPETVRGLLCRLAVLGEASMTTVITSGVDDAGTHLADLARRGLVRRTPGHVVRWSVVSPLSDLLGHEPPISMSETAHLHRLAADECMSRRAHADGLRHLLAAGDYPACATLLLEHGADLVNSGQPGAVLPAAGLPARYVDDPRIQWVIGQARQVRGEWASAQECFERASGEGPLAPELSWRVGLLAYAQGEFAEILALPGRTRITGEGTADEGRLLALVAAAHRSTGDLEGCRITAERAVEAAQYSGDPCAAAASSMVLAMLAAATGDRRGAELHWHTAMDTAEAADDILQVLRITTMRAYHLVELGAPRDGLAEAAVALRLGESCGDPLLSALALTIRGSARTRLGALDSALEDLVTARDQLQRIGSRFLAWPLCGLGQIYSMRGHLARARAAYEEAVALTEPSHEVLGLSSALTGLARVRSADDIQVAWRLADRAAGLGEGLRQVQALLTRGWVALMAGDRDTAATDAAIASAAARTRRDDPGLAEALMLDVLASADPRRQAGPVAEAVEIWTEAECRLEEAAARVVADHLDVPLADNDVDLAEATLRESGVDLDMRVAGPLGILARSAPTVSIRTLGVFQVLRDGAPIPRNAWQSRKARELLKILVARRRGVTRDQLMELLWPDADPARSANRLSVLLSTVRDVLASADEHGDAEPIATDGQAIWLEPTRVVVDVEEFLADAYEAIRAHRRGHDDALAQLVRAETKHTGEFMQEDPYQEWAEPLAEEVRATKIALLRALAARLRAAGDTDEAVRYLLRLLEQDLFDEPAHLDLIATHLEAGHHGEARRRHQIYSQRMRELGVEPRPSGTALGTGWRG